MVKWIPVFAVLLLSAQAEPAKTYTDPTHKYSITYPAHWVFEMKKDKENWFLFRHKPGTVALNPNLNLVREEIAEDAGIKTTADYMKVALEQFKKDYPTAQIVLEPMETKVDGKDFHRSIVVFQLEKVRFLAVQYCYYSPKHKSSFIWTAVDSITHPLKNIAAMEEIIQTIRFE